MMEDMAYRIEAVTDEIREEMLRIVRNGPNEQDYEAAADAMRRCRALLEVLMRGLR